MAVVAFDTLKLADRLQAGGFSAEQARTAAGAFADAMSGSDLATKADLAQESATIRAELADVEHHLDAKITALRSEVAGVRSDLKVEVAGVRSDLGRLEERIERRVAESDARMVRYVVGTGMAGILAIISAAWTIIRSLPPHL